MGKARRLLDGTGVVAAGLLLDLVHVPSPALSVMLLAAPLPARWLRGREDLPGAGDRAPGRRCAARGLGCA